jgi:hypothetical protein
MSELRKVKYCTHGWFGGQGQNAPAIEKDGWSHGVFQEGNNEVGIDPVIVVESLDGTINSYGLRAVKFVNQPDEPETMQPTAI